MRIAAVQSSSKSSLGWWDMKQDVEGSLGVGASGGDGGEAVESFSESENWWPGGGRHRIGVKMEDATVLFGEGEVLMKKSDRSKL